MSGRFDYRYEMNSIYEGMDRDLQKEVGQTVPWYVLNRTSTQSDSIYDTGSATTGRVWYPPTMLPVLSAQGLEGQDKQNGKGLYVMDRLGLAISVDALRKVGLGDVADNPEGHTVDRIVYQNRVFKPVEVRVKGVLTSPYAVVAVDAVAVMPDELVDDPQFWNFCNPVN